MTQQLSYEKIFHALPGGFIVLESNPPVYTVAEMTDEARKILKLNRKPIQKDFASIFHRIVSTEDLDVLFTKLTKCVSTTDELYPVVVRIYDSTSPKQIRRCELSFHRIHYGKSSKLRSIVIAIRDVTDLDTEAVHLKERVLADARRLKTMVATIPDIVWEARPDGQIEYANENWYRYIDRPVGSDISNLWLEFLHPDDIERTVATWTRSLTTGEKYEIEYRFREARTGIYNWFITRALPFRNEDGEIVRWFGTCTNIEAHKKNAQLLDLNKSKDEFISIASHQLRTPATAVKQYLHMLDSGMFGELSEQQHDLLQRGIESNERQLRTITDLLKVAQVDSGEARLNMIHVDMSGLVHEIITDMTEVFKNREQALVYTPFKQKAIANVDPEAMRMVIENIIDNASKYSAEDTAITVSVKLEKDEICIHIKDNGVGIPEEKRDKLFEKFSRIHNVRSTKVGGTGLGLYWAKRVIDMHEGKITYKENKPHGSIFTIRLKIVEKM